MKPTAHGEKLVRRGLEALGGPTHARVVFVLGACLALDGADKGAVSAMAVQLRPAFGIGNTAIGLLVTVSALGSAALTLPVGLLTDRVRRTRLLATSVALWGVAMVFGGASLSYGWLLTSRIVLGVVSATAGPTIASLVGDSFPVKERARMYGFVLSGELIGSGLGFAVSGAIGSALGWRCAFLWLTLPAGGLAWLLHRLPEPARGAQQREEPRRRTARGGNLVGRAVAQADVQPEEQLVLADDPRGRPVWWTVRYVLRVRTNPVLITASALGYFYFTGLRSFATLYSTEHYGISTSLATSLVLVVGIGAFAGVLSGGRLADRMLRRGRVSARTLVPTVCLLAVPVLAAPAFYTSALRAALPLLMGATFLLGAANPPLDAARLDVLTPYMWGTGEGVRTMLRTLAEAAAPLLFGWASENPFGAGRSGGGAGLEYTLLVFLLALVAAGLLGLVATRTYPRDVATAHASAERIAATLRARETRPRPRRSS